ncbi:hypothetical protein ACXR0O_05120 [Verrucomicrobiota bacterium sgz303538]
MKRTLTTLLLALGLSTAAFADVAIYSGNIKAKVTSESGTGTFPLRTIEVIDLATGDTQAINILKIGKFVQQFAIAPKITTTVTAVKDAKNKKVSTVFAYADTNTTAAGTLVSSVLLQGQNAQVNIKGTDKVDLPKTITATASFVTKAAVSTANGIALVTSAALKLDTKASKTANDTTPALTFDDVVNQIKQDLLDDGYEQVTSLGGLPGQEL